MLGRVSPASCTTIAMERRTKTSVAFDPGIRGTSGNISNMGHVTSTPVRRVKM
jgi:hypothetical protein